MKFRIKIDLSFEKESDSRKLLDFARTLMPKAVSFKDTRAGGEVSYIDLHLCGHDEGKPCEKIERKELINKKVVTIR